MQKTFNFFYAFLLAILGVGVTLMAEEITLTTYYPAPYGAYEELTTTGNTYLATTSGNVGIGTTTANYKLDVRGDINTTGDVRKAGVAYINPDYVFEPGYELMPLTEVKKYVMENRHLPNMPSTEEIKREGVMIFEQNRLLLEKLEEAYLHIFELEERIGKIEEALK